MRVVVKAGYEEMASFAAGFVADQVASNPSSVLGLATGSTPLGVYKELVRRHREEGLDFSRAVSFNLDEYVGLGETDPRSYHRFMHDNLFSLTNFAKENVHIPDGMASDLQAACERYEGAIREAGGIDLQLVGIGRDGHVGFNEPGSSLGSRTRIKTLTEETVADNARFFGSEREVPRYAITMGVGTILEAKVILMVANGKAKADAVRSAIEGPVTAEITASALQLHPNVVVVLDEGAASGLKRLSYFKYVERIAGELSGPGGAGREHPSI